MHYEFAERIKTLQPSIIREILKMPSDPEVVTFAAGNPSPETFPSAEMSEIAAEIFANASAMALQYGVTEGYAPLRATIKNRYGSRPDFLKPDDELIVVSGGQQGIELATKVLLNEGETILTESPSFIGALNSFRAFRVKLEGIPMESDGMDLDALEQALKTNPGVRMIYTIPTFHNPCGYTLSLEKRKRLLDLAETYNVMILEDSPYFELRYSGEDIPTLKELDKNGRVIFCGSFSKVISPGIRIGFACAPSAVISKMTVAKQVGDVHTNLFFQILVDRYLNSGNFDAHIDACCTLYREKRDGMLLRMQEHFGSKATWIVPDGGLFIWCELPKGYDGFEFCTLAKAAKVVCVPGNAFCVDEREPSRSFRLNFSLPSLEQIDLGIARLGRVLADYVEE